MCLPMSNVTIYDQVENMAELMGLADLSIGAGGTATWERCYLGLPSIIISVAENQISLAKGCHQVGAAYYLGPSNSISAEKIKYILQMYLNNPMKLRKMSKKGIGTVDGSGQKEIFEILLNSRGKL